jgi:hypothetical protein
VPVVVEPPAPPVPVWVVVPPALLVVVAPVVEPEDGVVVVPEDGVVVVPDDCVFVVLPVSVVLPVVLPEVDVAVVVEPVGVGSEPEQAPIAVAAATAPMASRRKVSSRFILVSSTPGWQTGTG